MTRVHHNPRFMGGLVLGRGASLGPNTLRVGQSETYGTVEDCLQNLRHDRVLGPPTRKPPLAPTVRRKGHGAPAVAEGSQSSASRSSTSIPTTTPPRSSCRGKVVRAEADHFAGDGDGELPTSGSRKASTTRKYVQEPTRSASTSGRDYLTGRRGRHPEGRRNGRRRKPAFRPRTSARSPASGARSGSISRPAAGATATAAPAATRPASNGRA